MNSWKVLPHFQIIFSCFLLTVFTQQSMSQGMVGRWQIKHGIWNGNDIEYADRLIALKLKQGISVSELNAIAGRLSASVINPMNELRWALLEIPEGQDLFQILQLLVNDKSVEAFEPEGVGHPDADPNDPFYGLQWGFRNTGQTTPAGTVNADIHLSSARDITQGNGSALLAIFDSGISLVNGSLSHPDLNDVNRIILGQCFTGEAGGVVDVVGHGTHVAGIAGAATNNAVGVAGVAPSAKLLIVKVIDAGSNMLDAWFQSAVIYAVNYASNIHVPLVINLSAGHPTGSGTLADAVQYAASNNALIVASAGNDQSTTGIRFPAGYSTTYSNLIAVGATDQNDYRSYYSNYGAKGLVSVVAPGGAGYFDNRDIYSTIPTYISSDFQTKTSYAYDYGTSMSAPMVSATAVLMLSLTLNSPLDPPTIRNSIDSSADWTPAMDFTPDPQYGWGRLNAYKALKFTIEHHSTTIGGPGTTVVLHENFTTLSGTTLTIAPGTTIQLDPGVVLYINGQLLANGSSSQPITFDRSGSTGTWNSLVFQSGSTGTVNYCTFNNASTGISCYSSNVTINNCTFTNCTGGVTCAYGAAPTINGCVFSNDYFGFYIVGSSPLVENNNIQNCTSSGIYMSGASPNILSNIIKNNSGPGIYCTGSSSPGLSYNTISANSTAGLYCESYSSPYLATPAFPGYNVIAYNVPYGVDAYYYSNPTLGSSQAWGDNSIFGNISCDVYANYNCTIPAWHNWWGVNSGQFCANGSTIDHSYPLPSNPNPGRPKVNASGSIIPPTIAGPTTDSTFNLAFQNAQAGNYVDAIALYLKVFNANAPNTLLAKQALVFLAEAYEHSGTAGFISYLQNQIAPKAAVNMDLSVIVRQLEAHWLVKAGNYSGAIDMYQGLHLDFASSPDIDKFALFNIGEIYSSYLGDRVNAMKALTLFESKYPNDPLASAATFLMLSAGNLVSPAPQKGGGGSLSKDPTPSRFELSSNYPNPFNPSTQISYSLPEAGKVSLVIYDVLGREVATLADAYQQSGRYTVTWNATQNSGVPVASGVYFARLRVLNDIGGVTFTKTTKLLLMK